jgi:hypothetical protein
MTDRTFSFQTFDFDRAAGAYRRVAAQASNPAARLALMVFVVILTIPIILFVLFAAVVAMTAFIVLSLAQRLRAGIRGLFARRGGTIMPRGDGRENVRVIEPVE